MLPPKSPSPCGGGLPRCLRVNVERHESPCTQRTLEMARVRLSTGQGIKWVQNVDVPERGFVPGGPISSLDDE